MILCKRTVRRHGEDTEMMQVRNLRSDSLSEEGKLRKQAQERIDETALDPQNPLESIYRTRIK